MTILQAINDANVEAFQAAVKGGENIADAIDENGESALMLAVRKENKDLVQAVLKAKADVSYQNPNNGQNALMVACDIDFDAAIGLLIKDNIPLDQADLQGRTALHYAVLKGNKKVAIDCFKKLSDAVIKSESTY